MKQLRIHASLGESSSQCRWALVDGSQVVDAGMGVLPDLSHLSRLPTDDRRVALVLSASDMLFVRALIPDSARHRTNDVLAFAVEDMTLTDADANSVRCIGACDGEKVLAVIDKPGLTRWCTSIHAARPVMFTLHCETLMLPWLAGSWSLAWNGREGFVRNGSLEGAATDCGSRDSPPLMLRLMLDAAKARGAMPATIAVFTTGPDAAPDVAQWQQQLGVPLQMQGSWDWRTADAGPDIGIQQQRVAGSRWQPLLQRFKPALWIAATALAIHCVGLLADWALLVNQQNNLRQQMEAKFRSAFPDAQAVADPALQMRRKLAEARHSAGEQDAGDFLPMIGTVAEALKELPPGTLHAVAYAGGRVTLEINSSDGMLVNRVLERLQQGGLVAERGAATGLSQTATITVRAS